MSTNTKYILAITGMFIVFTAQAQKKLSVSFGLDYVKYSMPLRHMFNRHINIQDYNPNSPFLSRTGEWVSVNWKNTWSLRLFAASYYMLATYTPADKMPDNFLDSRTADFIDLTIGKNILQAQKQSKIGIWTYAGIGHVKHGYESKISNGFGGGIDYLGTGRGDINRYYPCLQGLIKYNPLTNIFVATGCSYRYLFSDFQPLTANFSVGITL